MTSVGPMPATFVWGLKRSGIHLLVGWLYANHGATAKEPLAADGLHPQLQDGFEDRAAGVAFHNNCGRLHSRGFSLGDLQPGDFARASGRRPVTIFGIEDCALEHAARATALEGAVHVLLLRDPLNNLASRLEAGIDRPEQFRVDRAYIDLFDSYCREFLGYTDALPRKTTVSYNRFVQDRGYRDTLASALGLANLDVVSEVSEYGGGSSFSGTGAVSPTSSLLTRFQQRSVPRHLLDLLLDRPAVREACSTVFGYDLVALAGQL